MSAERDTLVSAIVAVNPHEYDFSLVLDAWASQATAGRYEVVVMHDMSRPGIERSLRAHEARHPHSPVRCLGVDANGRGALNNAGVTAAKGDLLIFSADDSHPSPGFVAAHRAFHEGLDRPGVGVGPIWFLKPLRALPFRRWLEDSGENYGIAFSQGAVAWQPGFFFIGNASLRRETFERIGGFDERFPFDMHEDHVFGQALLTAGYRFTHLPRAYALHDHPVDFDERCEAMRRLGATSPLLEGRYAGLARVLANSPGELEALRQRDRAAEAALAGGRTLAAWRRRWMAGLDLAYAEGVLVGRGNGVVVTTHGEGPGGA